MQLLFSEKFKPPKSAIIGLAIIGIIGTAVTGIAISRRGNDQQAAIEELLVSVDADNVTVRIEANGEVQPVQRVNVSPKTQGRLDRILVEQGELVDRNQVIAQMDSEEIEAQLRQMDARLVRAQANLEQLLNGSRPEEIDRAEARLEQSNSQRAQAQARVEQARARVEQAEANLAQLRAGSRPEEIAEAEASVSQAFARVDEARSRLNLAQIDVERNRRLEADGAIARSDLDTAIDEERRASANVEQAKAGLEEARRRLERLENGTRVEEIDRAVAEVDSAEADVASAIAEVDSAEAAVSEARAQLEELLNGTRAEEIASAEAEVADAQSQVELYETRLEDTRVRAPFAGIITQRYADPGAFVTPATSASSAASATSTSIVALAEGLEVLAQVPEADISQIEPGQAVEIVADSFPDEVFEGEVKLIAPEAIEDREVTVFEVRLKIETGLDKLRSGMNVDLTFLGDRLDNALVVPTVAIVTNKGQTGVLVPDEDDRARFREVTVGPTVGDRIQILDGVESGERIFLGLPEGQQLEEILEPESL
ncbi:MAG: efflux RND transporter periplasmic adaptor subunit [Cyanobacteriota bacterium]|nr:efflux RND transporter periplasmic adaptor subunit [Cyanobacteriota bacterium]